MIDNINRPRHIPTSDPKGETLKRLLVDLTAAP
jgi:hypothetical protein